MQHVSSWNAWIAVGMFITKSYRSDQKQAISEDYYREDPYTLTRTMIYPSHSHWCGRNKQTDSGRIMISRPRSINLIRNHTFIFRATSPEVQVVVTTAIPGNLHGELWRMSDRSARGSFAGEKPRACVRSAKGPGLRRASRCIIRSCCRRVN